MLENFCVMNDKEYAAHLAKQGMYTETIFWTLASYQAFSYNSEPKLIKLQTKIPATMPDDQPRTKIVTGFAKNNIWFFELSERPIDLSIWEVVAWVDYPDGE